MKRGSKIIIVIFLAVIFTVVVLSVVFLDAPSYSATSTQSFGPTSYSRDSTLENALVVYDPGSTDAAKNIADQITSDLRAQGYFVYLAGIKSATATGNLTLYKVIVVGGPIDNGKASNSVQSFLGNLIPGNGTRIGVFGVGSSDTTNDKIAPLPSGSNLVIKETLEISINQDTAESTQFVTQLLS